MPVGYLVYAEVSIKILGCENYESKGSDSETYFSDETGQFGYLNI